MWAGILIPGAAGVTPQTPILRGTGTLGAMPELQLPPVTAQMAGLDRSADVYQRLLKERIVFLGTEVDEDMDGEYLLHYTSGPCGRGETGRRARFRSWSREGWRFESSRPHHDGRA